MQDIDENDFIDACRMVYDGVRDVRHNYVSSLECDEGDMDSEVEEETKREQSQEKTKEKTHIREAVSRMKEEQLDLGPELKTDSPVYWVAVWANPEVRNLLSTQDLGGSQVDGFQEEKEKFAEIKERLRVQLEYQLTNFRFCFPFGRPEGALKSTLSLLERVWGSSHHSSFCFYFKFSGVDERYFHPCPTP